MSSNLQHNSGNSKVDYAGRTVDLLLLKTILDVPALNKRMGIDVSNVSGEPMIVTGVEKMVQRFANAFITAMGSVKFHENFGTNLVPRVGKGYVYDMATLEAEASEANLRARNRITEGDSSEDTPDDEKLVDSQVVDLDFMREKATVKISIKLSTAAGRSYVYIIPVPIGVH